MGGGILAWLLCIWYELSVDRMLVMDMCEHL